MNHRLYKTEKLLSKVAKGGFFHALFNIRGNQEGGPIGAKRAHLFSSVHGTISMTPFAKGQSKNNWKKIMVV